MSTPVAFLAAATMLLAANTASAQSWEFVDGPPVSCTNLRFYAAESAMMHGQVHGDTGLDGIVRTTDGGRNWTQITAPEAFTLVHVEFLGSQVFIAVGTDTSGSPQDWGPAIQRSDDGGQTWELVAHPSGGSGAMSFEDPDKGVFVAPNDGGIWSTTDGGRTWVDGGTPPPDYEESVRAAWMESGATNFFVPTGFAVRGDRAVYGAQRQTGTTVDAGASWNFFELDQHSNGEFPSNLQSADFASDDVVYAFSERAPQNPIPYHSTDGGVSWAPSGFERPADTGFNTDNRCIHALAEGLAYAGSDMSSFDPQPLMRLGDPATADVPDLDPWAGGASNNTDGDMGSGDDMGAGNAPGADSGTGNGAADDGGDDGGCAVAAQRRPIPGAGLLILGALLLGIRRR